MGSPLFSFSASFFPCRAKFFLQITAVSRIIIFASAGVMELADVTDSKLCSSHAVRNLKAFEIQGFPETKNPQKPAPTSKSTSKPQIAFKALSRKHLCRRDGIGRRVGLKIQWANHPCGFDPRRRHHPKVPKALILLGFRDFFLSFFGAAFSLD